MSKQKVQGFVRNGLIAVALVGGVGVTGVQAELPKGKPFQELASQIQQTQIILQKQIDAMSQQVAILESTSEQHTGQLSSLASKIELSEQQLALMQAALEGKQAKITGSSPEGSALRTVHADGTVECEKDGGGGLKYVNSESVIVLPFQQPTVTCPDGYRVTGGGYYGVTALLSVYGSGPTSDGKSWEVSVTNLASPIPSLLSVYAMCSQE